MFDVKTQFNDLKKNCHFNVKDTAEYVYKLIDYLYY